MKPPTGLAVPALVAAAMLSLAAAPPAHAVPMILNGGFELGLSGWTTVDQLGSDGAFSIQSGTTSPVNLLPVPPPPGGANAAMTDAQGPGSHVLYQDFVVTPGSATISFDLFIGNQATDFFTPSSLDFSTPAPNQQARVDILRASADPFSVVNADVLLNLYQTNTGDPLVSGYGPHTVDVSALFASHVGETLRLRFAETDNVFFLNLGVDNVSIDPTTPVPEPASILLFGAGLVRLVAGRLGARSRRARS